MAFPSNQFGHQENSGGQEILNALKYVRPGNGFEPKAIMFDKVSTSSGQPKRLLNRSRIKKSSLFWSIRPRTSGRHEKRKVPLAVELS